MPFDRQEVPPSDALDQLACRLLAEARAQYPQKPLSKPIGDLGNDVVTNLLAWLLDIYDDALAEGGDDWDSVTPAFAAVALASPAAITAAIPSTLDHTMTRSSETVGPDLPDRIT